MSAPDVLPTTGPARSNGPSLHGNDNQVIERRSLRDYYIIFRERLWIALPVALLVSLSWGDYNAQETPMYSSSATMQFERAERVVLNEQVVDTSVRARDLLRQRSPADPQPRPHQHELRDAGHRSLFASHRMELSRL